ncbi:primase C-terminal domain-containing protein [Chloroflexota bacterium]
MQQIIFGVPEGYRHMSAVRLVGRWYAIGLYPDEVKLHLVTWNRLNKPPMENSELKSILDSTLKWANPHCTPYLNDRKVNKMIRQINRQGSAGGGKT